MGLGLRAHVSEAEYLAVHRAEAAGADEPVAAERFLPFGPREAVGDHGRRDGRGIDGVGSRPEADAESGEPGAALGGHGFVAGEGGIDALFEQGLRPGVQRGDAVPVRGVGAAPVRAHGAEGQDGIIALIVHFLHAFPRGGADAHHAHARGAAQALLGTAEHEVDVPFVHMHGRTAEARHRVHIEQRHAEILLELAEQTDGVQGAGRGFAVHGGEHHRLDPADGVLNGGEVAFADAAIVGEGHLFHDAAEGLGHFADAVAKDAGADADHMIAGLEAAFQRAPKGEHAFAGHQGHIVPGAHELADAAAGRVVKAHEIGFDLTGTVIPAENGNDVFVQGDRAGDHGNGSVTHDDFLCVGVSAASGRGTFSRSTSLTSLSVMVMLRNRLPVRVNRCGSSVMKKRMRPARPDCGWVSPFSARRRFTTSAVVAAESTMRTSGPTTLRIEAASMG